MDEERWVDWYDVVEAVANGRMANHNCPLCKRGPLSVELAGGMVRVRCPHCQQGFEGRVAEGRDDGLYGEAAAMLERQAARRQVAKSGAPGVSAEVIEVPRPTPEVSREAPRAGAHVGTGASDKSTGPWEWQLPAPKEPDWDAYSAWMEIVESVYNGRRAGLRCPYCSEPLDDITVQDPFVRVRCKVCNEGFEGRFG